MRMVLTRAAMRVVVFNFLNVQMFANELRHALRFYQLSVRLDPFDANSRFNLALLVVQVG